jgi:hypothetical protein
VVLRGFPFAAGPPREQPQQVAILLNDQPLGTLELDPGSRTYTMAAPSHALRPGANYLELRYAFTAPAGGRSRREIAVAWDALALLPALPAFDATEADARLDEELDALLSRARPRPAVHNSVLHLPAESSATWTLDLGPGAELHLGGVSSSGTPGAPSLAVWLAPEGGAAPWVSEVTRSEAASARGSSRLALPLERFGTVRLSFVVSSPAGADPASGGTIAVREAKIFAVSSPSASRAASRPGAPPAPAAPPA